MKIGKYIIDDFKGITPQYVEKSSTIVINQKCIRDGLLSFDEAQYINESQSVPEKKYLREGDILICSTGQGTAGRCAYVYSLPEQYKVTIDSHVLVCRCEDSRIAQCLAYVLYSQESMMMTFLTGSSGQAEFDKIRLFDIDVTLPAEGRIQDTIDCIGEIENQIRVDNDIVNVIDDFIFNLYKYWFVQFDFLNVEGKPYKSSGGKMEFSDKTKMFIPEGWKTEKLTSYVESNNSGDWGKEDEGGNYTLKVNCIRGADLVTLVGMPTRYILNKNTDKLLKEGDIVIEISGGSPTQATGRTTLVTEGLLKRYDNSLICSNFCQSISLKDKDYCEYFYYTWKLFYENRIMFNYEGKTSGIKNLIIDALIENYWYFPPKPIVKKFSEHVKTLIDIRDKAVAESMGVSELRKVLLPLITLGQVSC